MDYFIIHFGITMRITPWYA